jgi:hypothetical protein
MSFTFLPVRKLVEPHSGTGRTFGKIFNVAKANDRVWILVFNKTGAGVCSMI